MSVVDYRLQDDHLAIITLSRPDKKNAINEDVFIEMAEAWNKFQNDDNAWVAILTGEGNIFSAGADLSIVAKQMEPDFDFMGWYEGLVAADPYQSGRLHKPVIAAVNGDAYGGGLSLILNADMVVSAEDAKFRMPESDFGGLVIMWQNVPRAFSMELNTGNFISARRFYDVGIFNRLVPADEVMDRAKELAYNLLKKPPRAVGAYVELLHDFYEKVKPLPSKDIDALTQEKGMSLDKTEDNKEAIKAFIERRSAAYKYK